MWGLHFFIRSIATLIRGLVIGHPTYMYKGVKMFNLYIPLTEENLFHVITSRADETICRWHVVRWTDLTANEWRLPVKFRGNNSAGCRETRTYPRIIPVLVCFPTFWIVYQLISTSSDIAEKKKQKNKNKSGSSDGYTHECEEERWCREWNTQTSLQMGGWLERHARKGYPAIDVPTGR